MSGNNGLGDATGDAAGMTVEANATISAGDVVALDQGASAGRFPIGAPANSGTADIDQVFGVAAEDIASGERGTVWVEGAVIANVASGVSQGARLSTSTTAGQAADADGGALRLLSDEGGTDRLGTSLAANEGEVYL
jgi:predicted RecA/RadA family phage recombinase